MGSIGGVNRLGAADGDEADVIVAAGSGSFARG